MYENQMAAEDGVGQEGEWEYMWINLKNKTYGETVCVNIH